MKFELTPDVQVDRDKDGQVIQLSHRRQRYSAESAGLVAPTPAELAIQYVRDVASLYGIGAEELSALPEALTAEPAEEGTRLRRAEEKSLMGSTVVSYQQTHRGLPVWNSSLSVVIYEDPPQVASSSSTLHRAVDVVARPLSQLKRLAEEAQPSTLQDALGVDDTAGEGFSLNGTRLLVYRYDPEERFDPATRVKEPETAGEGEIVSGPVQQAPPVLPLPPVPDSIQAGRHNVVREVLFTLIVPDWGELNWRAFVEPITGSVLYLRALTASASCCVFLSDPRSTTGTVLTAASPEADLNSARTCGLTLLGLKAPIGGVQALSGEFARALDTDPPTILPPTRTSPFSFEYSAVTDEFSAANGYFHTDAMYRMVKDFGFDVSYYFDGTEFPVPVDHRGKNSARNASADGNSTGTGMGKFLYGVVQSDQPVGIASAVRVCIHEFGHALLWDHVGSPNFGWCHSAGDTLAAILHDPGPEDPNRFVTFPFPDIGRRHDRSVSDGWAWGGARDDTQYGSEQILSTLMFRIYRVTGGDDGDINVRRFAARYLTFLIIKAIGTLTTTTTNPEVYVNALMNADESTPSFEGHPGGAWHKLFRWSFEKQGLYGGNPPAVDVYIDDGRNGEYEPYIPDFGNTSDIWNRLSSDGGTAHQPPAAGHTNYLYVRVKNRGTQTADNVLVKAYQGLPGSALEWPAHWQPLSTAQLSGESIGSRGEAIVGPFEWIPIQSGRTSVLASVSASGDASNADTVNGPIPNFRLVPLDNNFAQRDITAGGEWLQPVLHIMMS